MCNRLPRVAERLDEERLEILRTWGTGLSTSGRDELRAAGKAIVMLIEEIDRLQADVWMAGEAAVQRARLAAATPVPEPEPEPEPEASRSRLGSRSTASKPSRCRSASGSRAVARRPSPPG